MNARFIKIGAPCRGERVSKINRLLQIEDHLTQQDKLDVWGEHSFVKISPPPKPESEAGDETVSQPDVPESPGRKK